MPTVRSFADMYGNYQGAIDPHLPPYNAKGDCQRGANGETFGDNRFRIASYKFTAADIGKLFQTDGGGGIRTIVGFPDLVGDPYTCTLSGAATMPAQVDRAYVFGTDDTAALQKALDDARYPTGSLDVNGNWVRGFRRAEVDLPYKFIASPYNNERERNAAMGRHVVLRSGHKYLIHNNQASWDAGKKCALLMHRRHGLLGMGEGSVLSELVTFPGIVGDAVSNVNSRQQASYYNHPTAAFCDYLTLANVALFGNRKMASNGGYNGAYFHPSWEGYSDIDPRLNVKDVKADQFGSYGILLVGRMNGIYENLMADQNTYGVGLVNLNDTTVIRINCGGNGKTGVVVDKAHACTFTHIYSYFNGAGGTTSEDESCNLLVKADQARNGFNQFDAVHLQESRGPALVVDNSGYNIFTNMTCRDPGRNNSALNGGVAPTTNPTGLPAIRAGILLKGTGCIENDITGYVQSNVQVWDTPTYTGTEPLYITADPLNNFGNVAVMKTNMSLTGRPNMPDVQMIGGPGVSNGKNTGIRVNGAPLT